MWYAVLSLLQPFARHVDGLQRELLSELSKDFDCKEVPESLAPVEDTDETDEEPLAWLSGKTVGLYSLTEAGAKRAAALIHSSVPNCDIRLRHDHVASEQFRILARSVDVMFIVTRSAKHAATECIEQHLSTEAIRVFPFGKGASSIITALST